MSGLERIQARFKELEAAGRSGLITYIMGGDPDAETSLNLLKSLPKAGADFIELGFPFSDPMADGPTIQAAAERALEAGANLKKILRMVKSFREMDQETPLILMGYANPVLAYGEERLVEEMKLVGADGILVVDLPPEEDETLFAACKKNNIALIKLAAPTTNDKRLKTILKKASGFLYYVAISGVTGTKSAELKDLKDRVTEIRKQSNIPVAVGFGIKKPEQAKAIGGFADAVVVGSAIVGIVEEHTGKDRKKMQEAIVQLIRKIANMLK